MQVLKQSTAVDVLIGPFLDLTDASTAETGESPSVKLSKNGQTLAAKNDVTTPVHDADGYYNCELDATDTDTVGTLVLTVAASANALPVRHEYQVVEEATYDFLYASGATPIADINAEIDTALADIHLDHLLAADYDPASKPGTATALLNELVENDGGVSRFTTNALENASGSGATVADIQAGLGVHETTIATLASQTSFTLTAGSADDDAYNGFGCFVEDSATSTQVALGVVSDYTGSTKTVTLETDPGVFTMATGDTVILLPGKLTDVVDANVTQISGDATAADNLELDYDGTGYTKANSTIGTCTTNTDMRGTDSALLASSAPTNFADLAITASTGKVTVGTNDDKTGYGLSAAAVDAVWDENVTGGNHNVAGSAARFLREGAEAAAATVDTAQSGAAGTITLASGESATDDLFNGERIMLIEGTGAGQARIITDYDGTSKVATVDRNWTTNPDSTSVYAIQGADVDIRAIAGVASTVTNLSNDYDGTGYNKSNSTIGTCTTNTDMRGTDSAALASVCTEARLAELDAANLPATTDNIETDTQDIQSRLPAALVGGKIDADATSLSGSATAAANLEASALGIVPGTAQTGSSTTTIETNLTDATDDVYNGRVIVFTGGTAAGEATDITDYDGTSKQLTVTALAQTPANGDTFVIV